MLLLLLPPHRLHHLLELQDAAALQFLTPLCPCCRCCCRRRSWTLLGAWG
jgi:hypothetical protein